MRDGSMSEMHAEIEARDRARHETEMGEAPLDDAFKRLEHQLEVLRDQTSTLKARCLGAAARSNSAVSGSSPR